MFKAVFFFFGVAGVFGALGCSGGAGDGAGGGKTATGNTSSGTSSGTGSSSGSTTKGGSSFECCLNGANFACPSQPAFQACIDFNAPDPSGCKPIPTPCGSGPSSSGAPSSSSGNPGSSSSGNPGSSSSGSPSDVGNQCSGNADCSSDACLFLPGASFGYCSKTCMSFTDCPTFWSCDTVQNGSAQYCIQS